MGGGGGNIYERVSMRDIPPGFTNDIANALILVYFDFALSREVRVGANLGGSHITISNFCPSSTYGWIEVGVRSERG